ncbi:MAG: hypothetical protein R3D55_28180 [Chloroflexota bacterium]
MPLATNNGAENPYVGLLPFTAAEASYYFGREEVVRQLQTARTKPTIYGRYRPQR